MYREPITIITNTSPIATKVNGEPPVVGRLDVGVGVSVAVADAIATPSSGVIVACGMGVFVAPG